MDAIALLQKDHKQVEALFKRFEKLGPRALKTKQQLVDRIIRELSVHAFVEEAVFYPTVREAAEREDVASLVLESLEEHHVAKWTLSELEKMRPEDERYTAKATVLIESVRHHIEEEERELFPKVAKLMAAEGLGEMGAALAEAKRQAPTHPHPRSPDEPPGNVLAAPATLLIDKARDAGRKLLGSAGSRGQETARKAGEEAGRTARRASNAAKQATGRATTTAKKAPASRRSSDGRGRSAKNQTKRPRR